MSALSGVVSGLYGEWNLVPFLELALPVCGEHELPLSNATPLEPNFADGSPMVKLCLSLVKLSLSSGLFGSAADRNLDEILSAYDCVGGSGNFRRILVFPEHDSDLLV